jgi:hypothetical protein
MPSPFHVASCMKAGVYTSDCNYSSLDKALYDLLIMLVTLNTLSIISCSFHINYRY